jgi:hypothetical protein
MYLRSAEANSFRMYDYERSISQFYHRENPTDFYIVGNPEMDFEGMSHEKINMYSKMLSAIEIPLTDSFGIRSILMLEDMTRINFETALNICATHYPVIRSYLDTCGGTVNPEKIKQYIRAYEL